MGVIKKTVKVVGKTIGTTTLVVTGVASNVLKTASDIAGFEMGSDVFGDAKDASFNGIKKMWRKKDLNKKLDKVGSATESATYQNLMNGYFNKANAAKKIAQKAKQNGDNSKYEKYMAEYERYMEKYREIQQQYRSSRV